MLSSLAKYIFGGIFSDAPEQPMECETRDVNDWCLVNMPDQPEDDIELESEDDEDEILTALPLLMTQEEPAYDMPVWTLPPSLEDSVDERLSPEPTLTQNVANPRPWYYAEGQQVVPTPFRGVDSFRNIIHLMVKKYRSQSQPQSQPQSHIPPKKLTTDYRIVSIRSIKGFSCDASCCKGQMARHVSEIKFITLAPRRYITFDDHPAAEYPPAGSTHRRSPQLLPKTELLEQIKELKPSQRATERAIKKHFTRSQLNRQNKSYIFESSAKANRRKNLQRNPSGANNNRKCC